MEIAVIIAAVVVFMIPLGLIWYINFGGIYSAIKEVRANLARRITSDLVCSLDADCPPGYVCKGGRCIPAT